MSRFRGAALRPRARRSRKTALVAELPLVYADSSALVKLVVHEEESDALIRHLGSEPKIATSEIAIVEVTRAATLARPGPETEREVDDLLGACQFVRLQERLLLSAASLVSAEVRTLDAIHLASALAVEPDEVVVYDRRLREAAAAHGLRVAHPGLR